MTRTKITSWYVQGVANADDLSGLVEYLTELGGKHIKFGAEEKYFDVSC